MLSRASHRVVREKCNVHDDDDNNSDGNSNMFFSVLFLQTGAHSPLQIKEQRIKTEPKLSNACTHTCTCIYARACLHPHTEMDRLRDRVG